MNRRAMKLYFAAGLLASALLSLHAVSAKSQPTVIIDNDAFNPKTISINAGQAVTFINKDDEKHTVTADDHSFDSKPTRGTFQHRFAKAGRYPYHCEIHPFMHGVVVVR